MSNSEITPNRRVLIVDDTQSIHSDFREILCPENLGVTAVDELESALFAGGKSTEEQKNFELDSAFQGQEALEKVKKALAENRPYALAFVDVRMPPGWDGVETIARIWEVDPAIQIVVCTAYSDYSWHEMRAKVGQPDSLVIIKKPFDNIEVQQLAHALTHKWWMTNRAESHLAELVRANASLALSEERFSKAFNESPIPSAIQSFPDQRIIDVNARFVQATGYEREQLVGQTPAALSLWDKPEVANQWYEAVMRQELVRELPAKIRSRSGSLREVLVSLSPVALGGQPHTLLLAQDVSERVLLERQLRQAQKMEAVGQLAAGVAHDFNNMLTVIQGHSGMLQNQLKADSTEVKSAEQIGLAASRAATLTRQLLMFSRKQVMQFRHQDVNHLLRDVYKMLERLVGEQVKINFKPGEFGGSIFADKSMVEQIAMNLAINARDAMPQGGQLTIETSQVAIQRSPVPMDPVNRDGQFVCVAFSDTGIGMDTQVMSRIFEPFFTTKPPGKGTGLGLSTVFGIVRQHNGWLEVESKPDQGSTFRVYFAACSEPAERTEVVEDTKLHKGSETILIAEDEEIVRQMVVLVLKTQGYSVLEADSGAKAIEVFERANRSVDLLLTDMIMPGGMMGTELAQHLTKRCPALKVIYTSGYNHEIVEQGVSLPAKHSYLPKPYSIGKLAQCVRECLDAPKK